MSKHKSVAISGSDLLNRVSTDSDAPWREVICWNCGELDSLESRTNLTDDERGRMEELDRHERKRVANAWWVVSWPEHVTSPKFNSDANYMRADSEVEAIRAADGAYA